jgi:hypothetical protein
LFDRFAQITLAFVLLMGVLTFLILRSNPFAALALNSATVARPQTPRATPEVTGQTRHYCLTGDFLAEEATVPTLNDGGQSGDAIAGDGIFSITQVIAEPGTLLWQVSACDDSSQTRFPPEPAWATTREPNQAVTFTLDTVQRNTARFIAARNVVEATDSATTYRVVGDFQQWNPNDSAAILQPIGNGLYQQVRRLSQPSQYHAYILASGTTDPAITTGFDGYGRSSSPIPFSFHTLRQDEYVIFLLDANAGRATVLYNMHPLFSQIAFSGGHWIAGVITGAIALLMLLWLLWRTALLHRHKSWLESGCPRCHENELMRIERQAIDRLLHALGLPAYRYQCRHCTWQGIRLSIGGLTASPRSRPAARP